MDEPPTFEELLRRTRAGDQEAATTLVRHYEPAIRRVVRLRLANVPMTALLDSTDICQSVLASFFVRVNLGEYAFETPEQMVKLLATMARSKLAAQVRRQQAQRRDRRRDQAGADDGRLAATDASPSKQVAAKDLLAEVQRRLTPEERLIVDLRQQGYDWAALADQLGGTADGLRVRLSRAIGRVTQELGLDEDI